MARDAAIAKRRVRLRLGVRVRKHAITRDSLIAGNGTASVSRLKHPELPARRKG